MRSWTRVGNLDLADGPRDLDPRAGGNDVSFVDERARQLLGEEGVSLGLHDDAALQLLGKLAAGDGAHHLLRLAVAQRREVQLGEGGVRAPDGLVVGPVGHDQDRAHVVHVRDGHLEHLQGQLVHPLQILDDDHHRLDARERAHERADGLKGPALHLLGGLLLAPLRLDRDEPRQVREDLGRVQTQLLEPCSHLLAAHLGGLVALQLEVLAEHLESRGRGRPSW